MDILAEIEDFINEFNQTYDENYDIDSIRIDFDKQHKKEHLEDLGNWKKINKNDTKILAKLKKRLIVDEVTTAYQLENHNIYYYNKKDTANRNKKYRKATMVIFGMKQYHKAPPPYNIIKSIFNMLVYGNSKVAINIDVCSDTPTKPNLKELEKHFYLKQYIEPKTRTPTDTHYINYPNILMIEKLIIYNKKVKNDLGFNVWRIEALIHIPNIRCLALPLHDLKQITDIAKVKND